MNGKYPYEKAAAILKVMAHPVRLGIISLLEKGEMDVGHIQKASGIKQSITSQHLKAMADRGVLSRERRGNKVFYSIKKKEVLTLLACMRGCCE